MRIRRKVNAFKVLVNGGDEKNEESSPHFNEQEHWNGCFVSILRYLRRAGNMPKTTAR